MRWEVNPKGEYNELSAPVDIPATKDTYNDIDGWSVGWNGWPVYAGTIATGKVTQAQRASERNK